MDPSVPTRTRPARHRVLVGLAVAATLVTSACAAGQIAQTAQVKPSLDGVERDLGAIGIRALSIDSPTGPSYKPGSTAGISVVLVNSSHTRDDALTNVTTSSASGWGYFRNAQAAAAASGGSGGASGAKKQVPLPAGTTVALGRSGTAKLLLLNTKGTIFPGTVVSVTFTFQNAGTITIPVPVHLSATPSPAVIPSQPGEGANG